MVKYNLLDWISEKPWPKGLFHFDVNLYDIPRTVTACVANLPKHCIQINVVYNRAMATYRPFWGCVVSRDIKVVWLNEDLTVI